TESANPLCVDYHPQREKDILHLQYPMCRMIKVPFVQHSHDVQVLVTFAFWLIVDRATIDPKEFTLSAHAQFLILPDHGSKSAGSPNFFEIFFSQSRSTSSWPIFAYSRCFSASASLSPASFSNAALAFSKNSFFHLAICTA